MSFVLYRNDPVQLSAIKEFEGKYQSNDAICWYTKPGFLFFLLNKALRSGDILACYTFRYIIKDLCRALKANSIRYSEKSFQLYRGSKIHREEVENLDVGCIVTTNTFFSCSRDRRVAEIFIGINSSADERPHHSKDEPIQYALFEVNVDLTNVSDTVVASVNAKSELSEENEMIFTLGSTFLVDQINYDSKRCIWIIRISSFYDALWEKHKHDDYFQRKLEHVSSTSWFGDVLIGIESNHVYALDYCHRLLRIFPFDHVDRPDVYYSLGRIYRYLEKYDKALICFRSGLLLLRRLLPEKIYNYCRILGGLGTIYAKLDDISRAICLLERAILLQ